MADSSSSCASTEQPFRPCQVVVPTMDRQIALQKIQAFFPEYAGTTIERDYKNANICCNVCGVKRQLQPGKAVLCNHTTFAYPSQNCVDNNTECSLYIPDELILLEYTRHVIYSSNHRAIEPHSWRYGANNHPTLIQSNKLHVSKCESYPRLWPIFPGTARDKSPEQALEMCYKFHRGYEGLLGNDYCGPPTPKMASPANTETSTCVPSPAACYRKLTDYSGIMSHSYNSFVQFLIHDYVPLKSRVMSLENQLRVLRDEFSSELANLRMAVLARDTMVSGLANEWDNHFGPNISTSSSTSTFAPFGQDSFFEGPAQ